jgi:hypothetical protein
MYKAVTKEGPRAPLFCLGVALLIAAGGTAAQTVKHSDLELCAGLATSELKLACFEVLAAGEEAKVEPAVDPAPESPAEPSATESAILATGAAAGVAEPDAGSMAPIPAVTADDVQADSPDAVAQERPDEEYADAIDEIGREYLDEEKVDKKEEAVVRVTVSEVVKGGYDVLYFHFTNGQVWRQVESRRFSYPRDSEFDVIIDTGMMGDYRLRLAVGGPMTGIRRVK